MGKKIKGKKKKGLKKSQSFLSLDNLDISEDDNEEDDNSKSASSVSSIFDSDQDEKTQPINITPGQSPKNLKESATGSDTNK